MEGRKSYPTLPYSECSKRSKFRRRQDGKRAIVDGEGSESELSDLDENLLSGSDSVAESLVDNNGDEDESRDASIDVVARDDHHQRESEQLDEYHDALSHFSDDTEMIDDHDFRLSDFDSSDAESLGSIDLDDEEVFVDEVINNDQPDDNHLRLALVVWSISHRIGHNALCALLKILKFCDLEEVKSLPLDSRTLKRTPQNVPVDSLEGGAQYYHFGLLDELTKALNLCTSQFENISVLFGLDGLPLFKSVKMEFWPILCKILSVPGLEHHVFPIGLYCGPEKPKDLESYLGKFVADTIELCNNGVSFKGKKYDFIVKGFGCDCPAKSMVLCILATNAYGSCTKCTQKGVWSFLCRRLYFPEVNGDPRTNEDFLSQKDVEFHHGDTPLTRIPNFDFVNWFPLDYLHLLCLGVVRTLINLWVKPSKNRCHLHADRVSQASGRMLSFQSFVPSDFARDTRAFEEINRWKGTELRLFICYIGVYIMDGILNEAMHANLRLLYVAVRLLLNPLQCREFKETATRLLVEFVENCKTTYSPNILTHNFHNLIHLPKNLDSFENMEQCSTFDFESFLYILKKCLAKGGDPLQQAIKRWSERSTCAAIAPKKPVQEPYCNVGNRGPLLDGCCNPQFKNAHFPSFKLSLTARDCCCTTKDGSIVVVRNICFHVPSKSMVLICRKFLCKENSFCFPCDSSRLDVFKVSKLSELTIVPFDQVLYKNMILPCKEGYIVQPLLHTLS